MFKLFSFWMLFFISFILALVIQGVAARTTPTAVLSYDSKTNHTFSSEQESHFQFQNFVANRGGGGRGRGISKRDWKRMMIGSVAPKCTYNECRGCKNNKCRAQQVPVEGNDPMNSPYHYKCVCHRYDNK